MRGTLRRGGTGVAFAVLLSSCEHNDDRAAGVEDAFNAEAFRRYADVLVDRAGISAKVTRCAMFDHSRAGYCLLTLPDDQLAHWKHVFTMEPESVRLDDKCLTLPAYGQTPKGARSDFQLYEPLAGVTLSIPRGKLPPNTDNVRWRAMWTRPGRPACLEFEFPYG